MTTAASAASKTLEGRVALVTGGSRGIGRAVCLALAAGGADVAVNYRRNRDAALDTVTALRRLGVHSRAYRASVESATEVGRMVAAVGRDIGPITVVVNNAGTASGAAPVATCDPSDLVGLWRTHTLGPLHVCQRVVPTMRAQGRGDIVMISSAATTFWPAFSAPYNVAKAGMEALAYTLAREEAKHGTRVNIVAPGLVDTDMGQRLVRAHGRGREIGELERYAPFGRVCRPEDVGAVVAFLVSDGGSYITGERIRIDGGTPGLDIVRLGARAAAAAGSGDGSP